ncbi:MAG: peptidyl-Asp metalloendopeptidase [Fibrobacteres bacterium]|nr:peptidyl-Asp metalloendopeptidase [Fibrobacterota bacterium]
MAWDKPFIAFFSNRSPKRAGLSAAFAAFLALSAFTGCMTDTKSGERSAPIDRGLPLLFSSVSPAGEATRSFPEELRMRLVAVDPAFAADGGTLLSSTPGFLLNLFDDVKFTALVDRSDIQDAGRFTLNGHLDGVDGSYFILTYSEGSISLTAYHPAKGVFEITPAGDGIGKVSEFDPAKMPRVTHGAIFTDGSMMNHDMNDPNMTMGLGKTAAGTSVIDILVVYTAAAVTGAGGEAAMRTRIDKAVAEANTAFTNSRIDARLSLVRAQQINYAETGNMGTDLGRLQNRTDGYMDDVHAVRDAYKADLVSLIVENTGGGIAGIGYVMTSVGSGFKSYAFTAIGRAYTGSGNTLAHEVGHNLGCAHDRQNSSSQAAYPYSYGYRFNAGTTQYRTIMAYSPGMSIPYYSNPNVTYLGVPTGIPDGQANSADNARTINNTAPIAANFYIGVPPTTRNALLVVGNTVLNAGDQAVQNRLQALGFTVTVKSGLASTAADATGKNLVVVSSTVTSADVNTKFRAFTVPVLNWEQALQDDFGMTAATIGSAGTTVTQTQVAIASAHPISAGLTGTQTVTTVAGDFAWGQPGTGAVKVANQAGDATKTSVYAYEKGAAMVGLTAPARRVQLFLTDGTGGSLTAAGWTLFDNAAKWAAGF